MGQNSGILKKNKIDVSDQDLTFTKISNHLNLDLNQNIQTYILIVDEEGGEYLFEIGEKIFVGSLPQKCHIVIKEIPEIFFVIGFRKGQVLFKHFGEDHFLYKDYDLIPCKTYHLPIEAEIFCPYFKIKILKYKPFSTPLVPILDPSSFVKKIDPLPEPEVKNQKIAEKDPERRWGMLNGTKVILAFFLRFAIVYKTGPYFGTIAENYPVFSDFYLKIHLWFQNLIVSHSDLFRFFLDNPQDLKVSAETLASLFVGAILFDLCCHLLLGVSLGEAFLGIDQKEAHWNKRLKGIGRCLLSYLLFPFIILSIGGKGVAEKICKFKPVPIFRPFSVEILTGLLGLVICIYSYTPRKMATVVETPKEIPPLAMILPHITEKKAKEKIIKRESLLGLKKEIEIGNVLEIKGPIIRKSLVANQKNEKNELKIQLHSKIFHHDFLSLGNGAFLKVQLNNGKILELMQKTDATIYSASSDVKRDLEIILDFGKVVYDTNVDVHNKIIQENKYTPSLILKSEDSGANPLGGRGQFSYRKSLLLTTLFVSQGQSLFFPLSKKNETQDWLGERAMTVGVDQFSVYYHNAWKASVPVFVKNKEKKKQEVGLYNLFHHFPAGGEFNPISGLYFLKEDNYFDVLLKLRAEKGVPSKNILGHGEKVIFERIDVIGRIESRAALF